MKKILAALAVTAAVLLPAAPAQAHAQLVGSDPARDATLTGAPAAVTLTFSERLNPDFTTVVISDAAKQRVATSAPAIDGSASTVTFTGTVGNGTYLVAYRVVSVDGHTVQGSYGFTVADPALPAAVVPAAPPSAAAVAASSTGEGDGVPTGILLALGGAGVLLAVVAAAFFLAGRRRAATAGAGS